MLSSPGEADLTADVDFAALRRAAVMAGVAPPPGPIPAHSRNDHNPSSQVPTVLGQWSKTNFFTKWASGKELRSEITFQNTHETVDMCYILLQVLLKAASPSQAKELLHSYETLTSPEHMGQRFKFCVLTGSSAHSPTPFAASFDVLSQ